jgi:hypothetical protein
LGIFIKATILLYIRLKKPKRGQPQRENLKVVKMSHCIMHDTGDFGVRRGRIDVTGRGGDGIP